MGMELQNTDQIPLHIPLPQLLLSPLDLAIEWIDWLTRPIHEHDLIKEKGSCAFPLATVLQFEEPSSRTLVSFERAAQLIQIPIIKINFLESSLMKGEDKVEHFKTLEMLGANIAIIRSKDSQYFKSIINSVGEFKQLSFISAGTGISYHPTQALLDLLFLRSHYQITLLANLKNLSIVLVGDLSCSRVAGSLIPLLLHLGICVVCCSENQFQYNHHPLYQSHPKLSFESDLDKVIQTYSCFYLLRLQKERRTADINSFNLEHYSLNEKRFAALRSRDKEAVIMHPGPVNIGDEACQTVLQSLNYKGYHQVKMGLLLRSRLLYAYNSIKLPQVNKDK